MNEEDTTAAPDFSASAEPQTSESGPEIDPPPYTECPSCGNLRRTGEIIDDMCDSCRNRDRPAGIVAKLGWPEVRQRRLVLLTDSDSTQLEDRDPAVKAAFKAWRQELRDVTKESDPFEAWYKLDALVENRPSG